MFSRKGQRVYNQIMNGQDADLRGIDQKEAIEILKRAEADYVNALDKLDALILERKSIENTLSAIREIRTKIQQGKG